MSQQLAHNLTEKTRTADVNDDSGITFETLLLSESIQNGLTKNGFQKPSPIQLKAIPIGRCGFDLIVKSKSGTGKTLVYAIIALEMVNTSNNSLQVLILTPTREIAVQAADVIKTLGCEINGLKIDTFIGGLPLENDIEKIMHCHIAVGAPGRIKHLLDKDVLKTDAIRLLILDEADKLMDSSLQHDINQIYHRLTSRKQIVALSATYPNELDQFLTKYMQTPTHITQDTNTPILLGLKQFVTVTKLCTNAVQVMKIKNDQLLNILSRVPFTQCLVFTNYQTRAESVSNIINQKNWESEFISAAQPQKKRLDIIKRFKDFKFRVLLSTDLTSRGIDASSVDLVVNYDIPICAATYLHRMGRAGRYGSQGLCINIVSTNKELDDLQVILGTIGGLKLSIAKLHLDNDFNSDLWTADYNSFEQIPAKTRTNLKEAHEVNEVIKSSVLDLKGDISNTESLCEISTEMIDDNFNIEKKTEDKSVFKEVSVNTEENDVISMLQVLAAGKEVDVQEVNEKLKVEKSSPEYLKKRKRKDAVLKENNSSTQDIFDKNMALLSVSKLLLSGAPSESLSQDILNPIENYLQKIKVEETDVTQQEHENVNEEDGTIKHDYLENIFKHGFDFACKSDAKDWRSFVPKREYEKFEQSNLEQNDDSSDNDENEDLEMLEYEEENEEDFEMNLEGNKSSHSNQLKDYSYDTEATLVDGCKDASVYNVYSEPPYNEHYADCYRYCSDNLFSIASTFKNVEAFDELYSHWMNQLHEVRNYVQQNVYVQEMSKYQQGK